MTGQGAKMRAQQAKDNSGAEPKALCQGISRMDEPCNLPASVFCETCERWLCETHARDDQWHPCVFEPGDEGGEG
jgi:hypothetical protein